MKNWLVFDLSGTLAKMRPPVLLVKQCLLFRAFKKFNLGIITGARTTETKNILRKLEVSSFFKKIITKDTYSFCKPDARLFGPFKTNSKIIYIGDSKKDWQLSKNANISFLYVGKRNYGVYQNKDINQIIKFIVNNISK